jgi:F0F1-type ATP synthase membrane subunit b/b'
MINASLIAAGTYESHHWLLPETFEIIYGGIASTLVISALIKFAGPIVKKSLAARTERIQNEIDNARNARSNAETEAHTKATSHLQVEVRI